MIPEQFGLHSIGDECPATIDLRTARGIAKGIYWFAVSEKTEKLVLTYGIKGLRSGGFEAEAREAVKDTIFTGGTQQEPWRSFGPEETFDPQAFPHGTIVRAIVRKYAHLSPQIPTDFYFMAADIGELLYRYPLLSRTWAGGSVENLGMISEREADKPKVTILFEGSEYDVVRRGKQCHTDYFFGPVKMGEWTHEIFAKWRDPHHYDRMEIFETVDRVEILSVGAGKSVDEKTATVFLAPARQLNG